VRVGRQIRDQCDFHTCTLALHDLSAPSMSSCPRPKHGLSCRSSLARRIKKFTARWVEILVVGHSGLPFSGGLGLHALLAVPSAICAACHQLKRLDGWRVPLPLHQLHVEGTPRDPFGSPSEPRAYCASCSLVCAAQRPGRPAGTAVHMSLPIRSPRGRGPQQRRPTSWRTTQRQTGTRGRHADRTQSR